MTFRRILLAAFFFVLLAFAPVHSGDVKLTWVPVWYAYPGFFVMLRDNDSYWVSRCVVVILAHFGLSAGCAYLFERLLPKKAP